MAQLESAVGGRVLDCGRQGAKLTDLGRTLVRHADLLQSQPARAGDEVRLRKLGGDGPLVGPDWTPIDTLLSDIR